MPQLAEIGRHDLEVKMAVYHHFAASGVRPSATQIADGVGATVASVREAFGRLRTQRVLVLEADGESIRMAPPFSGVPTQHVVKADGVSYFANCAWDALGIPAALHKPATVRSRCEQSLEPLHLEVSAAGPGRSDWLFHCVVPASRWWDDIVFT
jgi:alkylmercury lyase-like protein